jgi:hypothetical protein
MRGRLVLVAELYGIPRVLVTDAVRDLGYPAKTFSTGTDVLAFLTLLGVQRLLADVGLPRPATHHRAGPRSILLLA